MKKRQKQSDFWEDFSGYLAAEVIVILKIVGMMLLTVFIFASLIVGVYHVVVYLFLLIIFGKEIPL